MAVQAERWSELPNFAVEAFDPTVIWETCEEEAHCSVASTKSISTYPILPHGERDGGEQNISSYNPTTLFTKFILCSDPNADKVWVQLHKARAILALADGCNWGHRPQQAAQSATAALKSYLTPRYKEQMNYKMFTNHNYRFNAVADLQEAAHLLLRAFAEADKKIMEGKEFHWEAGTTTLLGGILLRFKPQDNVPAWGFVCCSVGDCKAFLYSHKSKEVTDITAGNRSNVTDTRYTMRYPYKFDSLPFAQRSWGPSRTLS